MDQDANTPLPPGRLFATFAFSVVGFALFLSGVTALGSPAIAAPIGPSNDVLTPSYDSSSSAGAREPGHSAGYSEFHAAQPFLVTRGESLLRARIDESTICTSQARGADVDLASASCQAASRISTSTEIGNSAKPALDLRQDLAWMATVHIRP